MSIILNIETAIETSSVCLAQDHHILGIKINPLQKESAAWLHVAIKELIDEFDIDFHQLDAIAVSEGPGSYTGLRVGMATAKGLSYVLKKPLITIHTLQMMAVAAQNEDGDYACPMIDARRMEVFTAVLDKELNFIMPSTNIILKENSFQELLERHTITFLGNGSAKFQRLTKHRNARFKTCEIDATLMVSLSKARFLMRDFADLAYSQPFYGKDFHSSAK